MRTVLFQICKPFSPPKDPEEESPALVLLNGLLESENELSSNEAEQPRRSQNSSSLAAKPKSQNHLTNPSLLAVLRIFNSEASTILPRCSEETADKEGAGQGP